VFEAHQERPATVSKGEFARQIGVTPGRVSQYIKEGKILPSALVGVGVRAKIDPVLATQQLSGSLDISQRLGNGIETRLDLSGSVSPATSHLPNRAPQLPTGDPSFEDRIKAEKLAEMEMRNRRARQEELERTGLYTRTSDVRIALDKVASGMLNVFEGALSDLALAIAARFEVPQRDVLHLLRSEFRAVRQKAADAAVRSSKDMADVVTDEVSEAA